jgi:hypothetical protein
MCTRVGVVDRGRLVLQDRLDALERLTGRVRVRTPDAARVKAMLDGQIESHDGDRLLIRVSDPAALNRRLVEAGVRVSELAPERLALEDIVLAATSAGSDRIDRPGGDEQRTRRAQGYGGTGSIGGSDRAARRDDSAPTDRIELP